jgi:hypothetical protein
MGYIHAAAIREGHDEACRRTGKDFFVSYRMNDQHYVSDLTWLTHKRFGASIRHTGWGLDAQPARAVTMSGSSTT